jgi:hypothetical protein
MQTIIKQILNHPKVPSELLPNSYLKNYLESINNINNLKQILNKLNN